MVVIACRFYCAKLKNYLMRKILIIKKLIMTQSQIYLLAFSSIDQTTHQYTLSFLLSSYQRNMYYSIKNILIIYSNILSLILIKQ